MASPGDKWMGTAVTPSSAGLAYQRHALTVLAFVTESTVEIFNSLQTPPRAASEERDSPKDDAFHELGSSIRKNDAANRPENDLKEKAREVLSTELVSELLPELFFHIGERI